MRYLLSVLVFVLFISFLLNCESPTELERDAPRDEEGINYQIPGTPIINELIENIGFGDNYSVIWNEVERAQQYVIEESSDSLFVTAEADTIVGTSKTCQHYVNTPTTNYYRIKGLNGEYEGAWSNTVDVIVNPLDTPDITSQQQTIISGNDYEITWAAIDSAQSYILQESTTNSFNNPREETSSITSFTTTHSTESPSMFYYRVQARHSDYTSGWSSIVGITINPPVPASPVLESPIVHWNSVTLNWITVSYATSYTIEGADNRNFTQSVIYDSDNAITKIIFFDVDKETTMYYRIKANGISGSSDWSNTVECIQSPFKLELSVTDSEVFSEEDFTLNWTDVNADSYTIEEAANSNFSNAEQISVNGIIKSFIYYKENQQKLFYRVKAHDGDITSDWSNIVEVVITPLVPDAPILSEPVVNGNDVTVNWNDVKYATSFTLEASQDSTFSNAESLEVDTTSYEFYYNISDTTTYYYRVKALGVSGSSNWSNISSVTIEPITHEMTIAINPSGSGTTNPPPGNYTYNENTVISISAIPNEGYQFVSWTGDVTDANSDTTSVKLTSDMTVTANFETIPVQSTDITMVSIPGGSFLMGQLGIAEPVHTVTLSPFVMSETEITQGQYKAVVGSNPSYFTGDDNLPVEQVKWMDAIKFCNALSEKEGLEKCYNESTGACDFSKNGYRLPTEAEWEYACRAGTSTSYYTGDSESDLAQAGWYKGNSSSKTHPVGQKTPNLWGLYEMHGNVWEWCNDWHGNYPSGSVTDPTGSQSATSYVVRGGSWLYNAINCRSSYRFSYGDNLNYDVGFRVVRGTFTPGYTLSGTITGADGVIVTLSGDASDSQIVNDGGSYSFKVEHGGNYTVTPSKVGYTFTPVNQTFNNVIANQTQDFTASEIQVSTEITMVSIPGGTFEMGDVEGGGESDEKPVHTVTISSFEMSSYEITNAQYAAYLNETLTSGDITATSRSVRGKTGDYSGEEYLDLYGSDGSDCEISYSNGNFVVDSGKENRPVIEVTWYGSKAFVLYYGLDLPTEAEWEYACRGGKQYKYGTDDGTINSSKANYNRNVDHTSDVGSYPANPFGLYDMSGNLWEWCHDWYGSYPSASVNNPTGAQSGSYRVERGGYWASTAGTCRSARRLHYSPDYNYHDMGFRVVRRPGGVTY